MPVITPDASVELMAFLTNPLRKIVARLAKNSIPDDLPALDISTIVECDFPGYAPITGLEWAVDPDAQSDIAQARTQALEFEAGAIVVPQIATLVYVTHQFNEGATELLRYFPIPNGFLFDRQGIKYAYVCTMINVQE